MSGSSDSYEQRDGLRGLPLELMVSCETGEGSSSSWMISLLTSLLITTSDSVGSSGGSGGSLFGQKLSPQELTSMLSPSDSEGTAAQMQLSCLCLQMCAIEEVQLQIHQQ